MGTFQVSLFSHGKKHQAEGFFPAGKVGPVLDVAELTSLGTQGDQEILQVHQ